MGIDYCCSGARARCFASRPLAPIAVGAGGSLTSANMMVQIHRRCAGTLAFTTIERKARTSVYAIRARGAVDGWIDALTATKARLIEAKYGAVVCDYDGTLVLSSQREKLPRPDVVSELRRMLEGGVLLGIAKRFPTENVGVR